MTAHRLLAIVAVAVAGLAFAATASAENGTVVLVTHDSFAISKAVKAAFERETGLRLRILQQGDAGAMVNRALLTAGHPEGDVLFGIDDSLLSRALAGEPSSRGTPRPLGRAWRLRSGSRTRG